MLLEVLLAPTTEKLCGKMSNNYDAIHMALQVHEKEEEIVSLKKTIANLEGEVKEHLQTIQGLRSNL